MNRTKTEWKVKLASLGAFAGSLAGVMALEMYAPSFIERLPDGLQAVGASAVAAGVAWLSGWMARTRPESLSESTIAAARVALRRADRA